MPGKREQTILTPPCVVEALQQMWPEGIALDPCPEHATFNCAQNIPAEDWLHYHQGEDDWRNGLLCPWRDRTYCNPPYGELKKWMEKSYAEDVEHVMLVPVRTHRSWFRLDRYDAVAFLKPLKFVGFKQAFPAPLAVLYRAAHSHPHIAEARALKFRRTFEELSTFTGKVKP